MCPISHMLTSDSSSTGDIQPLSALAQKPTFCVTFSFVKHQILAFYATAIGSVIILLYSKRAITKTVKNIIILCV
jgi:hypothetical protein